MFRREITYGKLWIIYVVLIKVPNYFWDFTPVYVRHATLSRSWGWYDGKRRVLSTRRLAITRHCVPESYLFPPEPAPARRNIRSVLERLQCDTPRRLCLSRLCVTSRKSGLTLSPGPEGTSASAYLLTYVTHIRICKFPHDLPIPFRQGQK